MSASLKSLSTARKFCGLCVAGFLMITANTALTATLEEIIVTAQKREQSLADVPIAIQAFRGDFIRDNNIFEISDITERVPNVQFSVSPFTPIVAVRGLGASGGNRGFESQVVLFSDGIYGGRPTQFVTPMFDVERVEVVKGPQAVLFGKNATGGVVSVVSARPGDEFEGYLSGAYEAEYDGYHVEGVLSGPLSDELGARLAVRYKEDGGYLENTHFKRDEPEVDDLLIRGVVTWEPGDMVDIVAKLEYTEREGDGRPEQLICGVEGIDSFDTGPLGLGGDECIKDTRRSSGAQSGPFMLNADHPQETSLDTLNAALNMDWTVGEHVLTLLGGYSRFDNLRETFVTPDFSQIGFIDGTTDGGVFEQYSVEARIASPTGRQLEYILGAFYLDSDEQLKQGLGILLPPNPLLPTGGILRKVFDLEQQVETWSIFGSLTFNLNERLSATAQVRYSEEDKGFTSEVYQVISPFGLDPTLRAVFTTVDTPRDQIPLLNTYDLGRSEEVVDYTFNLQWDMTENAMVYISYAKGSKAGGFSFFPISLSPFPLPADAIQYEDEEGRNVEGGVKATFLDNRAQLNLAVFHTEYDDMQQVTFDSVRGGFDIANVEEVTSIGVELDGQFVISEQLRLGGALGYLDADFDKFTGVDCPGPPNTGNCNPQTGQDLDGETLPFAPDWTLNLFADFTMPVGGNHRLNLYVDGNFTDDILFQPDQDPFDIQDSYWIWNGRLAFEPLSERWELSVQAKNIGDKDLVAVYSADSSSANLIPFAGAHMQILRPGRQIYLQARWNF